MTVQFGRVGKIYVEVAGQPMQVPDGPKIELPQFDGQDLPEVIVQSKTVNDVTTYDLSNLRFKFQVFCGDVSTPNHAIIHVYNLSQSTANKIIQPARSQPYQTTVLLEAGYKGGSGQIFAGTVRQAYLGRESPTDTFLCIVAADGDLFHAWGLVSQTISAEINNPKGRLNAIVSSASDSIAPFAPASSGTTVRYSSDTLFTSPVTSPRGAVMFGMARKYLDGWAETQGSNWSIQNGHLELLANDEFKPGATYVLNSTTGMIGMPLQTPDGIKIQCLINPSIVVSGLVQINNRDIQPAALSATNLAYNAAPQPLAAIDDRWDGLYRVMTVDYIGDTRGQEWYAILTCLVVNADTGKVQNDSGYYEGWGYQLP